MKLYVTMVDTLVWEQLGIAPRRRIVVVDLMPEQVEKLTARYLGMNRGMKRYEEIEQCVLQEEGGAE